MVGGYREIVYSLFNNASSYTEGALLPDVCISRKLWRWMTTNSDQIETILRILLHPHIRSFRVRAALGRDQWQSLMSDLESVPLVTLAPPVPITYFLRGYRRPNAVELSMDMGYCGRATGIFRAVGVGAQGRFSQHQRYIRHASIEEKESRLLRTIFKRGRRR